MHDRRQTEPLRWGPFALDVRARELFRDGQRIRLQDKPFELLVALVERPGEVLSREELRSRLWPSDTFVALTAANTAVSKREALAIPPTLHSSSDRAATGIPVHRPIAAPASSR